MGLFILDHEGFDIASSAMSHASSVLKEIAGRYILRGRATKANWLEVRAGREEHRAFMILLENEEARETR